MAQSPTLQYFPVDVNDSALQNVLGTHRPDGAKIDLKPLLEVIDNILSLANNIIKDALVGKCDTNILTSQTIQAGSSAEAIEPLASVIRKISTKLPCKCSGEDAHESTIVIMKMLDKYAWNAKAVIAIAAFSLKYGEFCLFGQIYSAHPLAKYVAILKNLPYIAEHGSILRHLFGAVEELIGDVVELAKVMDQFDHLNLKNLSEDEPPLSDALSMIHEPAYWVIFSVVVCADQIASLAGVSTVRTTSYSVANLTVKVNHVLKIMRKHIRTCVATIAESQSKEKKRREENYERVKSSIENAPSQEKILEAIFDWEKSNLISCSGVKQDEKIFHDKKVLILISGLNITVEETNVLADFYNKQKEKKEQQAEIVWLPVIESGTTWEKCLPKIKELRGLMPWFTIEHPLMIKEEVIVYIKQEWHFSGKASLVAIDSSGKVQSKNAIDMLGNYNLNIFFLSAARINKFLRDKINNLLPFAEVKAKAKLFGCVFFSTSFVLLYLLYK